MFLKNILSILLSLPLLLLSVAIQAQTPVFSDQILSKISIGYENGEMSSTLARDLLDIRLKEIALEGKLKESEIKKANELFEHLNTDSRMDDGSLTGK